MIFEPDKIADRILPLAHVLPQKKNSRKKMKIKEVDHDDQHSEPMERDTKLDTESSPSNAVNSDGPEVEDEVEELVTPMASVCTLYNLSGVYVLNREKFIHMSPLSSPLRTSQRLEHGSRSKKDAVTHTSRTARTDQSFTLDKNAKEMGESHAGDESDKMRSTNQKSQKMNQEQEQEQRSEEAHKSNSPTLKSHDVANEPKARTQILQQPISPDVDVPSLKPSVPTEAPRTFYEFEKHANELHSEDFYMYFKVCSNARHRLVDDLRKVFFCNTYI